MKAIPSFETSIGTSHRNGVVFCCVALLCSVLMDTPDVSNVPTAAVVMFVKLFYYFEVWGRGRGRGRGAAMWRPRCLKKGLFVAVKLRLEII